MARARTVWGIDVGQVALKALKLREIEGQVQVEAFQVVEHPMILSQPDADRHALIREALEKFLAGANLSGCHVVISVSGQSGYSKFTKLPPVESRRVPDIVRFEAEQQIPFPINEVIWRWQTFRDPDSPDVEVGLFAMKRSDVAEVLSYFSGADISVDTIQMAPLALYNFLKFDGQVAEDGATLLADVGADKTDLVIADGGKVWTRTIQIGGNNFTEALVRTFKLSFDKAEKLKRTAASSKYARQVFQAMRPVFADLVQEIQRSVGYYTSLHRDTRFRKLIGLGNGFRLPGLQKFIEQNLNVPVARIDSYNELAPSPAVNAPALNENVLSFAVAYGLAVQGLHRAEVDINLLPGEILRKRRWNRKRPWFVGAAAVLLAAMFCPGYRANDDSRMLASQSDLRAAQKTLDGLHRRIKEYGAIGNKGNDEERRIKELARLFGYRDFWLSFKAIIDRSVAVVMPDQHLVTAYGKYLELDEATRKGILAGQDESGRAIAPADVDAAVATLLSEKEQLDLRKLLAGAGPGALKARAKALAKEVAADPNAADPNAAALAGAELAAAVKRLTVASKIKQVEEFANPKNRPSRRIIALEALAATYFPSLSATAGAGGTGGFQVEFLGRTPLPQERANKVLAEMRQYSEALSRWYASVSVIGHKIEWLPIAGEGVVVAPAETGGPAMPDPLIPTEDMSKDTRFRITWTVAVASDGIVTADLRPNRAYRLSRPTELLPDFDPTDAMKVKEQIKELPAGTSITIQSTRKRSTVPWYQVQAADAGGKSIGAGWVSGVALDQQSLEEVN